MNATVMVDDELLTLEDNIVGAVDTDFNKYTVIGTLHKPEKDTIKSILAYFLKIASVKDNEDYSAIYIVVSNTTIYSVYRHNDVMLADNERMIKENLFSSFERDDSSTIAPTIENILKAYKLDAKLRDKLVNKIEAFRMIQLMKE
jgi:hypothetical protein